MIHRWLSISALLLLPGLANGIVHYGAHNPVSEAWVITAGDSGVNATPISADPDFPDVIAWQINSSASGRLRYETPGPAQEDSWSYQALLRVVNLNDAVDAGLLLEAANGAQRFLLAFGSDSDGATLIDLVGDDFPAQADVTIAPTQTGRTDYLHVEITYDAQTDLAEVYVNGVLQASGWSGTASTLKRVNFGDGANAAAGVARFARVEFSIGTAACADGVDNNGDGVIDFDGADAACQSAADTTEGEYCGFWRDHDNDGLCEQRVVASEGDSNPALAGWLRPPGNPNQSYVPGDEDLGAGNCEFPCAFWRVTDAGTASGESGVYSINPAPATVDEHWELRAKLRLRPFTAGTAERVSYASTVYVRFRDGSATREHGLRFGVTAAGDMLASASGSSEEFNIGPTTDYHDVRVVYDPVTATADYFVDGVLLLEDFGGRVLADWAEQAMRWGSASSADRARTHWRSVALEMNPDSDNDGLTNAEEPALGTNPYAADSDDDGLQDKLEFDAGTDPQNGDTDNDGLLDGFEVANGLDPKTADTGGDLDGDGLTNAQEQTIGTRADTADTDGDGLSDGLEVLTLGSDPLSADTDGDGLDDGVERGTHRTDPLLADSDSDALSDPDELSAGTDPTNPDSDGDGLADGLEGPAGTNPLLADTDGDGMEDGFETAHGFNPLVAEGAAEDDDGDGLTNLEENLAGTSPSQADSDGDGLDDGLEVNVLRTNPLDADSDADGLLDQFEVNAGLNPLAFGDAARDTDNDGLTNLHEQTLGLDPAVADTDGDGYLDGEEAYIFGTLPAAENPPGVPLGRATRLEFVAADQPLFDNLPEPTFVDLAPLFAEQTGGTVRQGEVADISRAPSTLTAQDVWDIGVAQCDAYSYTAPVNNSIQSCGNLTVSPTRSECISGGRVNFNSRSVSCCAFLGVPDLLDDISNGCDGLNSATSFTIDELNDLPGGPYVTPTYIDAGSGFGPRPSADVPLPPRSYRVGAEVTQSTGVTGGITITPGLSSADPGEVDLYYDTDAYVRVDNSVVSPGEVFTLQLDHFPVPFSGAGFNGTQSNCTARQDDSSGSCMSSRWPAFSTNLDLDVSVDISVDAEIWSINPENGEQLHLTRSLFDETLARNYELAALDWRIGDTLDMRLLNGVPGVPDFVQQDISLSNADVFGLWNPGTKLPVVIDIPFGCFLKKISPALCIRLGTPENFAGTNLMTFQLQIPELNSPVSLPDPSAFDPGFDGGAPSNFSLKKVEPLRHALNEAGQLVNTVPNKFRPTLNLAGLDGSAESLIDAFIRNNTNLSSDVFRYELDVDGILCINSVVGCLGGSIGIPLVASFSIDALDFDLVMWTGWDSTLTFDPNLQAILRFSRDVEAWDADLEAYVGVAAYSPYVVDVPADGTVAVQVLQVDGGVEVAVEYSFADNLFSSSSQYAIKLAAETSFMQAEVGGALGAVYQAAVGVPWRLGLLNVITEAPPIPAQTLSSTFRLESSRFTFPGPTLAIIDAGSDSDRDGIDDDIEAASCLAANDADTDDDGLPDGVEDVNRNGVVDPGETDPCDPDSDGDGLQDGRERGLVTPHPDTNLAVFQGNPQPLVRTDPNAVDTDGDGFSDAQEIAEGSDPLSNGDCPPSACQSSSVLKIILLRNQAR